MFHISSNHHEVLEHRLTKMCVKYLKHASCKDFNVTIASSINHKQNPEMPEAL
jgi:hypothetical protein